MVLVLMLVIASKRGRATRTTCFVGLESTEGGSGGGVSDEGVGRRSMRLSESERVRKYLGRRSGQERRGRLNEIGGDWGRFGEI